MSDKKRSRRTSGRSSDKCPRRRDSPPSVGDPVSEHEESSGSSELRYSSFVSKFKRGFSQIGGDRFRGLSSIPETEEGPPPAAPVEEPAPEEGAGVSSSGRDGGNRPDSPPRPRRRATLAAKYRRGNDTAKTSRARLETIEEQGPPTEENRRGSN